MSRKQKQADKLRAKSDVEAAIKRHGLESVKYIVNRHVEASRLTRELAREKKLLEEKIKAIEAKLKR